VRRELRLRGNHETPIRENRLLISWQVIHWRRLENLFLKYDICIKVINDRIKKGIVGM
jgi:hypothetical protein